MSCVITNIIDSDPLQIAHVKSRVEAATVISAYMFRKAHDNGLTFFGAAGGQFPQVQSILLDLMKKEIVSNIHLLHQAALSDIPPTLATLQPYSDKDKVPNVVSPFHMLFQMLRESFVQPFHIHSNWLQGTSVSEVCESWEFPMEFFEEYS
jgi:hypothetical protein